MTLQSFRKRLRKILILGTILVLQPVCLISHAASFWIKFYRLDNQLSVTRTLSTSKHKIKKQKEFNVLHSSKKLNGSAEYPLKECIIRDFPDQLQRHFMMQPCEGVFSWSIQLFCCQSVIMSELCNYFAHFVNLSQSIIHRKLNCLVFYQSWRREFFNITLLRNGLMPSFQHTKSSLFELASKHFNNE